MKRIMKAFGLIVACMFGSFALAAMKSVTPTTVTKTKIDKVGIDTMSAAPQWEAR